MKNPSLPVLLGALVLGSLSASLTTFLLVESDTVESRVEDSLMPARPGAAAGDALARLESQVADLILANRALQERLDAMELRPSSPSRIPAGDFVSREELEALRDELHQARLAGNAAVPEGPALKEHVASALTEIRKDEAVRKTETYQEKRSARLDEDVTKLSEWLELDAFQQDGMRSALLAQYEREAELARLWREGSDAEVLGEMKRTDREAFRTELTGVLTPDQLTTFWNRFGTGGKR